MPSGRGGELPESELVLRYTLHGRRLGAAETSTVKILVVDDEPDIRRIAQIALSSARGWDVLLAADGREALRLADASLDAILLDLSLPGMKGEEIARRLRESPATAGVPIFLMTARVLRRDDDLLAQTGVDGLIPKPFDPLSLGSRIEELLGPSAQPVQPPR